MMKFLAHVDAKYVQFDFCSYCKKYGVDLDPRLSQLCGIRPQMPWRRFVNADNQHLASQQVRQIFTLRSIHLHDSSMTDMQTDT